MWYRADSVPNLTTLYLSYLDFLPDLGLMRIGDQHPWRQKLRRQSQSAILHKRDTGSTAWPGTPNLSTELFRYSADVYGRVASDPHSDAVGAYSSMVTDRQFPGALSWKLDLGRRLSGPSQASTS